MVAKYLNECYQKGAESFGWSKRNSTPRSVREGDMVCWYGNEFSDLPWQGAVAR